MSDTTSGPPGSTPPAPEAAANTERSESRTDSTPASSADGAADAARKRRRRGSRGGRGRSRSGGGAGTRSVGPSGDADKLPDDLPDRGSEGKPRSPEVAERALVRKPQIGDTRPAPSAAAEAAPRTDGDGDDDA